MQLNINFPIGSLIFQLSYPSINDTEFVNAINKSAIASLYQLDPTINITNTTILNHVAIVVSATEVIEASASAKQVKLTLIEELLLSAQRNILVIMQDETLAKKAVTFAYQQLGQAYKFSFDPDEDGFYCSELICAAYPTVFKKHPMSFLDITTQQIVPFWHQYYQQQAKEIPQGKIGSHPTTLFIQQENFQQIIEL